MCAKSVKEEEYEEEVCAIKEEKEPQLLDAQAALHAAELHEVCLIAAEQDRKRARSSDMWEHFSLITPDKGPVLGVFGGTQVSRQHVLHGAALRGQARPRSQTEQRHGPEASAGRSAGESGGERLAAVFHRGRLRLQGVGGLAGSRLRSSVQAGPEEDGGGEIPGGEEQGQGRRGRRRGGQPDRRDVGLRGDGRPRGGDLPLPGRLHASGHGAAGRAAAARSAHVGSRRRALDLAAGGMGHRGQSHVGGDRRGARDGGLRRRPQPQTRAVLRPLASSGGQEVAGRHGGPAGAARQGAAAGGPVQEQRRRPGEAAAGAGADVSPRRPAGPGGGGALDQHLPHAPAPVPRAALPGRGAGGAGDGRGGGGPVPAGRRDGRRLPAPAGALLPGRRGDVAGEAAGGLQGHPHHQNASAAPVRDQRQNHAPHGQATGPQLGVGHAGDLRHAGKPDGAHPFHAAGSQIQNLRLLQSSAGADLGQAAGRPVLAAHRVHAARHARRRAGLRGGAAVAAAAAHRYRPLEKSGPRRFGSHEVVQERLGGRHGGSAALHERSASGEGRGPAGLLAQPSKRLPASLPLGQTFSLHARVLRSLRASLFQMRGRGEQKKEPTQSQKCGNDHVPQ